jgi:hypothetical protein
VHRLVAISLVALVGCGEPVSSARWAITDGVQDDGHRAVGYVRMGDSIGCTGTSVGRRTVLVAGHCISPGQPQTFVLEGADYTSSSSAIHPEHDPMTHDNDIGLLILGRGVHVVPTALAAAPGPVGQEITLVGFGATAQEADDVGTKRTAVNTIESLHPTSFNFAGTGNSTGNVCHKDSGGPVYAGVEGPGPQLGVVIGGEKPCGTRGIAMRVDVYLSWLRSTSGDDLAVEGEHAGYGLPCVDAADCQSGLCVDDGAGGDRYCSTPCGSCPEDAPCLETDGGQVCGLPPPPADEGCAIQPTRRPGRAPVVTALLLGLPLLLLWSRRACPCVAGVRASRRLRCPTAPPGPPRRCRD